MPARIDEIKNGYDLGRAIQLLEADLIYLEEYAETAYTKEGFLTYIVGMSGDIVTGIYASITNGEGILKTLSKIYAGYLNDRNIIPLFKELEGKVSKLKATHTPGLNIYAIGFTIGYNMANRAEALFQEIKKKNMEEAIYTALMFLGEQGILVSMGDKLARDIFDRVYKIIDCLNFSEWDKAKLHAEDLVELLTTSGFKVT